MWDVLCLVVTVCLGVSSGIVVGVCGSGGIVVGVYGLFLRVTCGFVCRVLCMSFLSLSRLCMIYLGLVIFGFGTKDSPLLRTSFSALVSLLLLRLTIVSVVFGCWVRWCWAFWRACAFWFLCFLRFTLPGVSTPRNAARGEG